MSVKTVRAPVTLTIKGSIAPPRGTPGANSAFVVDLEVKVPVQGLIDWVDTFLDENRISILVTPRPKIS